LISSETSLAQLHEILLLAFAWSGEHLHLFHIHGRDYGVSQYGGIAFSEDARQVRLSRFRLHDGERFRYEYDLTAGWALDVRLERAFPWDAKRTLPECTGGSRAAPPEDCGGAMDYLERMDSHRLGIPIEDESGRIRVLGRVVDLRLDSWTEPWVPSPECILPLLVEYAGSNLEQKMCSALTPPHLLAFYHPFADDLIDC
jgi:hypothetical protein